MTVVNRKKLTKFILFVVFINITTQIRLEHQFDEDNSEKDIRDVRGVNVPLDINSHIQNIGDVSGHDRQWIGTKGQSLRLQGFSIKKSQALAQNADVKIEYMAHIQDIGDTAYQSEGAYIGTRGQEKRLQGFAIRLTGLDAGKYDIIYQAHLQGTGDTEKYKNGQFCGTRGQSRRVEAIIVQLTKRG